MSSFYKMSWHKAVKNIINVLLFESTLQTIINVKKRLSNIKITSKSSMKGSNNEK